MNINEHMIILKSSLEPHIFSSHSPTNEQDFKYDESCEIIVWITTISSLVAKLPFASG